MKKYRLPLIIGSILVLIVSMQNCSRNKEGTLIPDHVPVSPSNVQEILTNGTSFNYYVGLTQGDVCLNAHLSLQPDADLTFMVASNDTSITDITPASLTFTPENWAADQSICLNPANYGTTSITVAAGSISLLLPVTIGNPPVVLSRTSKTVGPDAGQFTTTVKLNADPGGPVTIPVDTGGLTWISLDNPTLDFNSSNWDTGVVLTVSYETMLSTDLRNATLRMTHLGVTSTLKIRQDRFAP